ncbi:MAG TPA: hypothetical protein VMK65_10260, partial [Longimicrobiales bacterium]|nr:hypothetical protein [Longimicrobiales bacterium]
MFRQMMWVHWQAGRWGILPMALAAFALPLLSIQAFEGATLSAFQAAFLLDTQAPLLPLYPLVAALTGVVLGASAWGWDHTGSHVYAMSLPLARWEYVLAKLGTGALLALVPVAAFLAGALLATAAAVIPPGLTAYPLLLSWRFLLAVLLAYALVFALSSGSPRTGAIALAVFTGVLIGGQLVVDLLARVVPGLGDFDFAATVLNALVEWPGPFQ